MGSMLFTVCNVSGIERTTSLQYSIVNLLFGDIFMGRPTLLFLKPDSKW